MKKTNESRSSVSVLLSSAVLGLITTLIFMLIGAVLVHRGVIEERMITPLAFVFLALGCFIAALVAAKRAEGGKLLLALGAGGLVFLLLLAGGILLLRQPVHIIRVVISSLCALAGSLLGGLAGANMRKKKRYSHLKK